MKNRSCLYFFCSGLACGVILLTLTAGWILFKVPSWLVVKNQANPADIAVILGGGGGSRLRTGLDLYTRGFVQQLILVDKKKEYWDHMISQQCPNYKFENKKIVILEGSSNTITDARLTLEYCIKNTISNILIITDPYHTRRALITFNALFKQSNIAITVISSADYGNKLTPQQKWWTSEQTCRVIWDELGKIIFMLARIH